MTILVDQEEFVRRLVRLGIRAGELAGPLPPPTDAGLDEFERTGVVPATPGPSDAERRATWDVARRAALRNCPPRFKAWLTAALDMAEIGPFAAGDVFIITAEDFAAFKAEAEIQPREKGYTLDQLRQAWGAGVGAAKRGLA